MNFRTNTLLSPLLPVIAAALGCVAQSSLGKPEQWGGEGPGISNIGTAYFEGDHLVFSAYVMNYGTFDVDNMVSETIATQNGQTLNVVSIFVNPNPGNNATWELTTLLQTTPNSVTFSYCVAAGDHYQIKIILQSGCNPGRLQLSAMAGNGGGEPTPFNDLTLRNPYAPPALALARAATNAFDVAVSAPDASAFLLQYRDTLAPTNWTDLRLCAVTGAVTVATDTNAASARFYRAIVP